MRVGSVRRVLCAAPAYLKEYGTPEKPEDLHAHRMIASTAGSNRLNWRFRNDHQHRDLRLKARLNINTNDSAIAAALKGFGITRLLSYQIAPHLESGKLQTILADWEPEPSPIHILHREGRHAAAKVRSFIDLMAEQLRSDPALNH